MATEGSVSFSNARKTENIGINGGMSLKQGLAKFYNCAESALGGQLAGQQVRLNSGEVTLDRDGQTALRDRDTVTIYADQVARGGVKGA